MTAGGRRGASDLGPAPSTLPPFHLAGDGRGGGASARPETIVPGDVRITRRAPTLSPQSSPSTAEGVKRGPALLLGLSLILGGCQPSSEPPLVIATPWPAWPRAALEAGYRAASGDRGPIAWVVLEPGARLATVLDRRGGVDLVLGGFTSEYGRLADSGRVGPWHLIRRPVATPSGDLGDPREDPETLARARAIFESEGWPRGFEFLIREAARSRPDSIEVARQGGRPEPAGLVGTGRSPGRAHRFLDRLEDLGPPRSPSEADGLLADLLGAALVDAREELRAAAAALERYGHPARAEGALGDRPPWPPTSIRLLKPSPALLDTLAEQVAPDPEARAWLRSSWSGPSRPVDGDLLAEIAGAVDGRLAREPRFRAWLRAEWIAWTRQHYRRVARVAGGYVPS